MPTRQTETQKMEQKKYNINVSITVSCNDERRRYSSLPADFTEIPVMADSESEALHATRAALKMVLDPESVTDEDTLTEGELKAAGRIIVYLAEKSQTPMDPQVENEVHKLTEIFTDSSSDERQGHDD